MVHCIAYKCTNRSSEKSKQQLEVEKTKNITFHKFPKDPERRNLWIHAVRRKGWMPTETSRLCSMHFEDTCFNLVNNVMLRDDAVPTIFSGFPVYMQKTSTLRRPPLKRQLVDKPVSEAMVDFSNPKPNCSVDIENRF